MSREDISRSEYTDRSQPEDRVAIKSFRWHLLFLTVLVAGFVVALVLLWAPWQ